MKIIVRWFCANYVRIKLKFREKVFLGNCKVNIKSRIVPSLLIFFSASEDQFFTFHETDF